MGNGECGMGNEKWGAHLVYFTDFFIVIPASAGMTEEGKLKYEKDFFRIRRGYYCS